MKVISIAKSLSPPLGAILLALAVAAPPAAGSEPQAPGSAVSYFLQKKASVEWRVYAPGGGRDRLVRTLKGAPDEAVWDPVSGRVYYRIGRKIFGADWKAGAAGELVLELPEGMLRAVQELWIDAATGRWRFSALERIDPASIEENEGRMFAAYRGGRVPVLAGGKEAVPLVATVWGNIPDGGGWILLERAPSAAPYGTRLLREPLRPRRGFTLTEAIRGMQAGAGSGTLDYEPDPLDPVRATIRPEGVPGVRLRFDIGRAEDAYVKGPVVWENRRKRISRRIYGTSGTAAALGLRGRWLLIGREQALDKAELFDLRDGKKVFAFPEGSSRAVWVPAMREGR